MTRTTVAAGAAALVLLLIAVVSGYRAFEQHAGRAPGRDAAPSRPIASSAEEAAAAAGAHPSFLYGRVITNDGGVYEGRLRWGGDEEAFWGDYFNGFKDRNPWAAYVPGASETREPVRIFGLDLHLGGRGADLGRPFMARFGDIARIESIGDGVGAVLQEGSAFDPDVRVTLKSGTSFNLDRLEAGDFDDGVRVWDERHGVVDLGSRRIRTIELLPGGDGSGAPDRIYGTVRTRAGSFTGFIQWDRERGVGRDELVGRTADGEVRLRFDALRAIARHARDGARVTLRDGREMVLSDTRQVGHGHRGIYVDDPRYGRVLVSWDAFVRVDFSHAERSPSYDDFPPGRTLSGRVTTRDGRRLAGRLVYDLDESETTETLDAPSRGVDYTLPFGLVASIVLPPRAEHAAGRAAARAEVTLHSGEVLPLERRGDLGDGNGGLLVFAGDGAEPQYVPWSDVERIDFDRPRGMNPPVGGR